MGNRDSARRSIKTQSKARESPEKLNAVNQAIDIPRSPETTLYFGGTIGCTHARSNSPDSDGFGCFRDDVTTALT